MRAIIATAAAVLTLVAASPLRAADAVSPDTPANVTVQQVKSALAAAKSGQPADFSGKSLKNLDLSDLDFENASFVGANLYGTKLAHANMRHANLTRANLNLSWLIAADFTGANLTDASLVAPVVAQGLDATKGEIPIFKGADLSGARVQARFTGGALQGAKFAGGDISAHLNNQSMGLMHTEMGNANLEGADFSGTKMGHVDLSFADLKGANFRGADLSRADLTGADATGADFSGADLQGTDLADTKLAGAKGLHAAKNLAGARGYKEP